MTTDYRNWLQSIPGVGSKPLGDITLPGTHDSGAVGFNGDFAPEPQAGDFQEAVPWLAQIISNVPGVRELGIDVIEKLAQAQRQGIGRQLDDGIRVLDLRAIWWKGKWHLHHGGLIAGPLDEALMELREFLDTTGGEVVLVELHRTVMPDDRPDLMMSVVLGTLGERLYPWQSGRKAADLRIEQVADTGSRALVFNNDEAHRQRFWPRNEMSGSYANSANLAVMQGNQREQILDRSPGELRRLWCTLTAQQSDVIRIATLNVAGGWGSLEDLSYVANQALESFFELDGAAFNVAYVDFYDRTRVVDLCIARTSRGRVHAEPGRQRQPGYRWVALGGGWFSPEGLASLGSSMLAVQGGKLWRIDPGGGSAELGSSWGGVGGMTAFGGRVLVARNADRKLYSLDRDGKYRTLSTGWWGTQGLAATDRFGWAVWGPGHLSRIDADGNSRRMGDNWGGIGGMAGLGPELFVFRNADSTLYRVQEDGSYERLSTNWPSTEAVGRVGDRVLAAHGGTLYAVRRDGAYDDLGSHWSGTAALSEGGDGRPYAFHSNQLWTGCHVYG